MKVRTSVLAAGAVGVVALVVGLVANSNRLDPVATASAQIDSAIVVVGPQMLAIDPEARFSASASGSVHAYAAREADVQAWLGTTDATYVTSVLTWDELETRRVEQVQASPTPSPSPSASPSATPSPTPSPSPTGEAEGTEPAAGDDQPEVWDTSSDMWRQTWTGHERVSIEAQAVEPGLVVMFVSADGTPLTGVDMRLDRPTNDAWITPVTFAGLVLTIVGLLTLATLAVSASWLRDARTRVVAVPWLGTALTGTRRWVSASGARVRQARAALAERTSRQRGATVDITVERQETVS